MCRSDVAFQTGDPSKHFSTLRTPAIARVQGHVQRQILQHIELLGANVAAMLLPECMLLDVLRQFRFAQKHFLARSNVTPQRPLIGRRPTRFHVVLSRPSEFHVANALAIVDDLELVRRFRYIAGDGRVELDFVKGLIAPGHVDEVGYV